MRSIIKNIGKVILAGAGPGDPELITLKALRFLKQADVVIVDRLVSPELLLHVKMGATVLYAGKQGGNEKSTSQKTINELLVKHALQNKLVLRLKGGDVSFFSNILNELATLTENNIPYEIIPGVTAASGAAASAGIPLTAKGYSNGVRFITCYDLETKTQLFWNELADTNDTLVFYMSSEALPTVVAKLLDNRISSDKELAMIEQATTPFQKVTVYNLHEFETKIGHTKKFASPTLVIIGRVATLHRKFKWKENSGREEDYFIPLADRTSKKKTDLTIAC